MIQKSSLYNLVSIIVIALASSGFDNNKYSTTRFAVSAFQLQSPQKSAISSQKSLLLQRTKQYVSSHIIVLHMTPEEERAKALSDYLAKAHEEKLRAIKEVEMKKNNEIQQLQQQIDELKATGSSTSSAVVMANNNADAIAVKALEDMSKEELLAKIVQYQNYMRTYMINAQEQKYYAVMNAKQEAQKKLSESLTLLGIPSSSSSSTSTAVDLPPLYMARNTNIMNAIRAGRPVRWGTMEVNRVQQVSSSSSSSMTTTATTPVINGAAPTMIAVNGGSAPTMITTPPIPQPPPVSTVNIKDIPVPPEVIEADHGLRSDNSIGGPTLAERVFFGATNNVNGASTAVPSSSSSTTTAAKTINPSETLYQLRNEKVVQAAKAGISNRWGSQEINRISPVGTTVPTHPTVTVPLPPKSVNIGASMVQSVLPVTPPPEVIEADHGLRSDNSIGGLTLAERVFYGANSASTTAASATTTAISINPLETLYHQRNKKIVQASQAGKSNRWGQQEIDRISNIVAAISTTTQPNVQQPKQQRVNFGASIVSN